MRGRRSIRLWRLRQRKSCSTGWLPTKLGCLEQPNHQKLHRDWRAQVGVHILIFMNIIVQGIWEVLLQDKIRRTWGDPDDDWMWKALQLPRVQIPRGKNPFLVQISRRWVCLFSARPDEVHLRREGGAPVPFILHGRRGRRIPRSVSWLLLHHYLGWRHQGQRAFWLLQVLFAKLNFQTLEVSKTKSTFCIMCVLSFGPVYYSSVWLHTQLIPAFTVVQLNDVTFSISAYIVSN